ncbi:heterokaryon incompatibility protein-domain-containing protein [Halenospora varia]|nr:heterokaryon incompatibility protein-domain-containing protein [Halenospora varia]
MRPVVDRSEASTLTSWGRTEPPESKWPVRLIDVHAFRANETSKKDSVRLVEVRGSCPKYTTLSHRWDRTLTDEHKTTLWTIDLHRARIPLDELTLKFRDAVEITRRMGISYLWIDALCIIQDSDEDWNAESLKMGGIYENSFLTIAANQEGDGGCFNKQSMPHDYLHTERKDMQSVEITNTQPDGRESTVLFHYEKRRRDPLPLRSSILNNRGWIYQERILSPRTVHFTQTQAVWECREMYKLEDLLPSPTAVFDLTFSALILKDSTRVRDVVDHWHRGIVCGDYSRRDFTAPEDRLIALAGVAKIWQYYINDTYLAGIWQSHLAFGLAWMRDEHRKLAPTAENCRRPTWTWASHNGFVAWWPNHSSFQPEARLALRKTELRYCGNKPETFGKVDGGFITIEGVISQVVVQSIPENAAVSAKMEKFPVKFFVDSLYPKDYASPPVRFPALALGHGVDTTHWIRTYLLVLKPISSTQLSYWRVGFAYVDFQTLEQRTKFWAGITPQVIHLF